MTKPAIILSILGLLVLVPTLAYYVMKLGTYGFLRAKYIARKHGITEKEKSNYGDTQK